VVEEVRGRKPVLVGVGYALPVVLELVKAAETTALTACSVGKRRRGLGIRIAL